MRPIHPFLAMHRDRERELKEIVEVSIGRQQKQKPFWASITCFCVLKEAKTSV